MLNRPVKELVVVSKRIVAVLASLLLMVPSNATAETQYIPVDSAKVGEGIVAIKEMAHSVVPTRFVIPSGQGSTRYASLCIEADDGTDRCAFEDPDNRLGFGARAILPVCVDADEENCISGVRYQSGDGEWIDGSVLRSLNMETYGYEDDRGLFRSGAAAIWKLPGKVHQGGTDLYFVNVANDLNFDYATQSFIVTSVKAVISPFVEVLDSKYGRLGLAERECTAEEDCPTGFALEGWGDFECVWQEAGVCGKAAGFAEDTRLELEFRASTDLVGWFRGRIQKAEISISDFSPSNRTFTVGADPVEVARFEAVITEENTNDYQQALADKAVDTTAGPVASGYTGPRLFGGNIAKGQMSMSEAAIEWVKAFKHITDDAAIAISDHWNFETVFYSGKNSCLSGENTSGVLGIVSSNATAMLGTPPNYDSGFLSYKVAGLHYAPDGETVNEGTYDLVMRSDVARCLYGFKNAPISATVAVVGECGEEKVATTVVSEKDGWLKLAAYGFTFS